MKRADTRYKLGFHEWPLVLFTALTIVGAGLATAWLFLGLIGWLPLVPPAMIMMLITVFLGVGFLSSTGHLGRRLRGHLALIRVGRSPLSNEVLLLSLALLVSGAGTGLAEFPILYAPVSVAGLALSFLLLPALGVVYNLPGQLTWTGPSLIHPLILGLGFGLTFLLRDLPPGALARGELIVLVVFMVDGLLVWERTRRIGLARKRGLPVHPKIFRQRGALLSLRILLGILIPAVSLYGGGGSWPCSACL